MKLRALSMAIVLLVGPAVAVADDLEDAIQSIKDASAKKDAPEVKKLAAAIFPLTSAVLAKPAPQDAEEKKTWQEQIAYAKNANSFAESAVVTTALQSEPEVLIDLLSTLEQLSPKSKYLDEAYGSYLLALNKSGASAKIPAIAEKGLANFPDNEDLLLYMTDTAMNRKQADRALVYANRLTASLNKHAKPEGMSAADWERKRSASLAHGYYVAGVIYADKGVWLNADKNLRAAVPLIQGQPAMQGPAYYFLGVANYQLGKMTLNKPKMLEAIKFSEQSMAIAGPYQSQAQKNAFIMKDEAARMR